MAKEAKKEPEPVVDAAPAAPPKSYRMQILLGLACLVLFQMIVLWLLLPSRSKVVDAIGIDPVNGVGGFEQPNDLPPSIGKREVMIEKPINESKPFKVKQTKADSESTETFTVTINGKIRKKDERAFDKRYAECLFEINDAVTTVLQGATPDDRQQVGFTSIKEKVKKAINDVLGTPYIQEILTQD
ncbi:MAG: hypothetical protein LBT89_09070, partial [Planctomycetaceae bacterium]|nr:hypothetical protein [Planctomycetaceae bacterium]